MLTLKNLKSPGSNKNTKRLGRGKASGQGVQAGKGHKGQWARSGGGVRIGFEGGQLPLYMRLPKRGFSNHPFKVEFALINLEQLENNFNSGENVNRNALIERGLLKGENKSLPLKLLAKGTLTKSVNISDFAKLSKTASEAIVRCNGKIQI
jgi:large subunit ribosomal protein L15